MDRIVCNSTEEVEKCLEKKQRFTIGSIVEEVIFGSMLSSMLLQYMCFDV